MRLDPSETKSYIYQVGRGHRGVFTEGVEENGDGEGEMARLEGA